MHDPRWDDDARDRDGESRDLSRGSRGGSDPRTRERIDPRDVFQEYVRLPRGPEREQVFIRDREHMLRGSESRTLSTAGAFRVVRADDIRDTFGKTLEPRQGELCNHRGA